MENMMKKLSSILFIFSLFVFFASSSFAYGSVKDSTRVTKRYSHEINHGTSTNATISKKRISSGANQASMDVRKRALDLRREINLSTKQTKGVENILQNYKENKKNQNKSTTLDEIDNILSSNQKTKFDV
jgi:hypothetical protein